jgi:hypothetical protein
MFKIYSWNQYQYNDYEDEEYDERTMEEKKRDEARKSFCEYYFGSSNEYGWHITDRP